MGELARYTRGTVSGRGRGPRPTGWSYRFSCVPTRFKLTLRTLFRSGGIAVRRTGGSQPPELAVAGPAVVPRTIQSTPLLPNRRLSTIPDWSAIGDRAAKRFCRAPVFRAVRADIRE